MAMTPQSLIAFSGAAALLAAGLALGSRGRPDAANAPGELVPAAPGPGAAARAPESAGFDPERPVEVFAKLDGDWQGTFVGWHPDGREAYRISVEQHYETVDANTQRVRVVDTMPDGETITGEGENTARRREDGTLELRCVVRKSNGETVRHDGRLGTGPRGEPLIFWYSLGASSQETFREWVVGEGAAARYHIHGYGRYGDSGYLMAGEYARPADDR